MRDRESEEHPEAVERLAADTATVTETEHVEKIPSPELREAIAAAIEGLPEREKLVVTLKYYEELKAREIAQVLGVSTSTSTVDRINRRALKQLAAHLRL